ncbi:MAG: UvrB/UvrC motif-containing protein, partial [Bacteroidetes bacterium]|nr:UvrB/UvrC motif-containing protein [Bacteroidota bacterium]
VAITVTVLERFAEMAADEHGVTDVAELLELQGRTYARVNPHSKHVVAIKRDRLPELPGSPGVYFMKDGRGKVLYVGKARDLSKRVTSYFNAIEAHPPRIRQLIAKVRDVTWNELPTELHALIEESRQIKTLDPSFNRAQKRYMARPYLRLDIRHAYPRLTVQVIMRDDGAEYYGPFRSRSQAHSLLELIEAVFPIRNCPATDFDRGRRCVRADIGRCPAPCTGSVQPQDYADIVGEVRRFLRGDVDAVADQLEAAMLEAAEAFRFEEAAKLRDWIALLEERIAQGGAVAQEVSGPEVIHYLKAREGERATLVVMAVGRIHTLEAPAPDDPGGHHIRDALRDIESADARPTGLRPWEADARRLLDHWLHVYRNEVVSIERRAEEPLPSFAERAELLIGMHLEATRPDKDQPNIQRTT